MRNVFLITNITIASLSIVLACGQVHALMRISQALVDIEHSRQEMGRLRKELERRACTP